MKTLKLLFVVLILCFPKFTSAQSNYLPSEKDKKIAAQFLIDCRNRSSAIKNNFEADIAKIQFETLLDPDRIKLDTNFTETKKMLSEARSLVNKYRKESTDFVNGIEPNVIKLEIDQRYKEGMLEGYRENRKEKLPSIEKYWDIQSSIVADSEKLFKILESNKKAWIVKDESIQFLKGNSDVLKSYNETISQMMATSETLDAYLKDSKNEAFSNSVPTNEELDAFIKN